MCEMPSFRASNPNNRQSKLGFYLFSPRLWTKPPQLLGMRIGKIRNERSVENAVDRRRLACFVVHARGSGWPAADWVSTSPAAHMGQGQDSPHPHFILVST